MVVTVAEANSNPWFNMVVLDEEGRARLVNAPGDAIAGRQLAPKVYEMTTVAYVARPAFVLSHAGMFTGRVRSVLVPRERAVDIDTLLDFRIAECLMAGPGGDR